MTTDPDAIRMLLPETLDWPSIRDLWPGYVGPGSEREFNRAKGRADRVAMVIGLRKWLVHYNNPAADVRYCMSLANWLKGNGWDFEPPPLDEVKAAPVKAPLHPSGVPLYDIDGRAYSGKELGVMRAAARQRWIDFYGSPPT